ncbi:MAG: gamma carbonic anhydrase family protein [Chloroflexi bacterium]|nr:gamma carbonic anhydrase family protein [Chloroflexota bacterium]
MPIYAFEDRVPEISPEAYVHPEATVGGDVVIEAGCYIGPGARLRADWGSIRIGRGSNVQENCVLHVRPTYPILLETDCHIGHSAVLHGCTLRENVLIGIGAIVLDGVEIGPNCIVGAGSVITSRVTIPAGKMVWGVPAEIQSDVTSAQLEAKRRGTGLYQTLPKRYQESLRRID